MEAALARVGLFRHRSRRASKCVPVFLTIFMFLPTKLMSTSIPVAKLSKAKVYDRSLARIAGLNPAGGRDACLM